MYWVSIWMNYFGEWRRKCLLESEFLFEYRLYAYRLVMGDMSKSQYDSEMESLRAKYRALGLSDETMRSIERFPIRLEG